jgi:hypothetical protein
MTFYTIFHYYKIIDDTVIADVLWTISFAVIFLIILALEQLNQNIRQYLEQMRQEVQKNTHPLT